MGNLQVTIRRLLFLTFLMVALFVCGGVLFVLASAGEPIYLGGAGQKGVAECLARVRFAEQLQKNGLPLSVVREAVLRIEMPEGMADRLSSSELDVGRLGLMSTLRPKGRQTD
jgi:hypothetical protein